MKGEKNCGLGRGRRPSYDTSHKTENGLGTNIGQNGLIKATEVAKENGQGF